MLNDCIPFQLDGDTVTARADGAILGKRLVKVSDVLADGLVTVAKAGAASIAYGVASRDAADGANVMVFRPGPVLPVVAGEALTAGWAVKPDANGELVHAGAGDLAVGVVEDDCDDGDDARLSFQPFTVSGAVATAVTGDQAHITHLTNNTAGAAADGTIAAIPDPADTPATADALRDDLVANTIPALRNALTELATTVNAILTTAETAGLVAP